jgi:hypothetical protein
LLFPFLVYQAKKLRADDAWNNPIKDANFQALNAAKMYLKMQATLVRHPGDANGSRQRQYESSTSGQVFMLISEGSKWELRVAYWIQEPERSFYVWRARDGGQVVRPQFPLEKFLSINSAVSNLKVSGRVT